MTAEQRRTLPLLIRATSCTTQNIKSADTIAEKAGTFDPDKMAGESQTPYLKIRKGKIVDHEGRHRMAALAAAGHESVPVVLWHDEAQKLTPVEGTTLKAQFPKRPALNVSNAIPLHNDYRDQIMQAMGGDMQFADGGVVDDAPEGITAYHGTPHDFEQFDLSKIGTGEGAQAYGHGLYFAEAEPIAQHYRDALTQGAHNLTIDGVPFAEHYTSTDPEKRLKAKVALAVREGRDIDSAIDWVQKQKEGELSSRRLEPENKPELLEDLQRLQKIRANPPKIEQNPGRMYEVQINAHPDHFLDWDIPLNKQPIHIQEAIKNSLNDAKKMAATWQQRFSWDSVFKRPDEFLDYKGASIQNLLARNIGAQHAADVLHKHGVKGIKYFDASSRKESEGSRNYVVFDDKLVNVKRKYAQGGMVSE
jgi:hypothetical protein